MQQALGALEPERRGGLVGRWGAGVPEPTGIVVDLVAGGRGTDLVSLGLVAQVLWAPTDDPALAQRQTVARARLEPLFGRDRLDARSAAAWGTAAAAALQGSPGASADLDAADRVLADAGAAELALLSDDLPHGFDARLAVLGAALAARNLDACLLQLTLFRRHRQATRRAHRVEMAEAAIRLLRRTLALRRVLPRRRSQQPRSPTPQTARGSTRRCDCSPRGITSRGSPTPIASSSTPWRPSAWMALPGSRTCSRTGRARSLLRTRAWSPLSRSSNRSWRPWRGRPRC